MLKGYTQKTQDATCLTSLTHVRDGAKCDHDEKDIADDNHAYADHDDNASDL